MGFGSYDESEQENRQQSSDGEDGSEAVNVHKNDHDGDLSFETEADADELIDRLEDMREEEPDGTG